jgi:hypothetical protein
MHRLAPAILVALTTSGCALLLPNSALNVGAMRADNPLKAPLVYAAPAQNLPMEGEPACTIWPIEDDLTITATDTEFCAKGQIHVLLPTALPGPDSPLNMESDGTGEADGSRYADRLPAGPARKLGTCVVANEPRNIWAKPYDGCVPNKDTFGKPVLTLRSSFLRVNDLRWRFEATAPEPTSPAAAPPAATAKN